MSERHRDGNIEVTTGYRVPIKSWTVGVEVEDEAWRQLGQVAEMRCLFRHLAVMPDVHWGKGATVGSVIATKGAVIPSAIGVDIGCGMMAVRTTLDKGMLKDLPQLRKAIEAAVPHGMGECWGNKKWSRIPAEVEIAWEELKGRYRKIVEKHGRVSHKNPMAQIGTLGGGNHFIEVCVDEEEKVWFMLHSGSRRPGMNIADYFIFRAKDSMKKYDIRLPNPELAFLPEGTADFNDYIEGVEWCQRYAAVNREVMMDAMTKAIRKSKLVPKFERTDLQVNCHHNFVRRENHFKHNVLVTRKGAVSAREGQLGIIPGSMGTQSYIVEGLGNPDSFMSCSHGAGRRMSRKAAKETFTLKDHRAATEGIECRKDSSVIDETPGAYKSIDTVMAAQKDLVNPIHTLRQVICIKG